MSVNITLSCHCIQMLDDVAVAGVYDATMIAHFVDIMSILLSLTKVKMAFVHLLCYLIRLYSNKTHR